VIRLACIYPCPWRSGSGMGFLRRRTTSPCKQSREDWEKRNYDAEGQEQLLCPTKYAVGDPHHWIEGSG
jgi:hypothetical protein